MALDVTPGNAPPALIADLFVQMAAYYQSLGGDDLHFFVK
jgi:hypothetical protein